MAVDKLVDSTQLNADLTSVANAIRTKGGTSVTLAFPTDFISAINALPTGGGGTFKYEKGSFTLANDVTIGSGGPYAIAHNLGQAPDFVCIFPTGTQSGEPNRGYIYAKAPMGESQQYTSSTGRSDYPEYVHYNVSEWGPPLVCRFQVPSSPSYLMTSGAMPTASNFYLNKYTSTATWPAGTYKYFISEKWW